jgi:hypothetical protein
MQGILGMDWPSKHNELINCAKKAVRLTTSNGKELEYVAEMNRCSVRSAHHEAGLEMEIIFPMTTQV